MNTTITRLSHLDITSRMRGLTPDLVQTLNIQPSPDIDFSDSDFYFLGCQFANLGRRIKDTKPLSAAEKALLPWLDALRKELRSHGAKKMQPEFSLPSANGIRRGRCDLFFENAYANRYGIVEAKVKHSMPDICDAEHLLQLGRYVALAADYFSTDKISATLAYIDFRQNRVRMFTFRDTSELQARSHLLLKAA